ncbi:MAG: cupin-like domain-containing protein [Bacteroidia bacterium]
MNTVDKRANLSLDEFVNEYYNHCKPVVIKDATHTWIAHEKWNAEFFKDKFADRSVEVDNKTFNMSDYMGVVMASTAEKPAPYLNEVNIAEIFRELLPDLEPYFQYGLPDRLKSTLIPKKWGQREGIIELLIGGQGTCFPVLHYDGFHMHAFVTQIKGDKEFYFISPDQTKYLYTENINSNKSPVNFFNPDYKKYPLFKQVQPTMVLVKEGESIYIPSGWWHTTRILSLSIAVSINSMNRNKWNNYVNDFAYMQSHGSRLRSAIFKAYLIGVGKLMTVGETLNL